jgi:Dihydrodipicolinate synthetase family
VVRVGVLAQINCAKLFHHQLCALPLNMVKVMRSEEFRTRLPGVIAFPVTPFNSDFSLDLAGLRKNVQELLRHPVAAIVAAGGTGEMYSLTPAEHQAVVKSIVEEVHGKIPVIAGTGFNRQMAIELAQQSRKTGADGILALPPYYPNADQEGLAEYYAAIGAATPLGLFVYSRDWKNPQPSGLNNWPPGFPRWLPGKTDKAMRSATRRSSIALATGCTGLALQAMPGCLPITRSAFVPIPRASRPSRQNFQSICMNSLRPGILPRSPS